MSKIRLVHFTSSLKIGGAEKILFDLVTHLNQNKYEQTIIYIHDGPYRKKLQVLGFATIQVSGFMWRYDPWLLICLWQLIRRLKPDVIHTMLWGANVTGRIVARVLKIPCVCVMHNNSEQNSFMRTILDRCTICAASSVIAVSDEVAQSVARATWIPVKKIKVIPNGIALQQIQKQVSRSTLGFTSEHFIIGSVGRFHPIKRYDVLLKVFAQIVGTHAHVRLILVGIGEQEQKLRLLADELGIKNYVTFVIGQSAQNYYSLCDCFVQTSAYEGISVALLEAMSFGLPCIVMKAGSVHSVIKHGQTGLVVHVNDIQGMSVAIKRLIQDSQLAQLLGRQAKIEVQTKFALETMIRSYDALFEYGSITQD